MVREPHHKNLLKCIFSEKWAALESPGYRVFLLCIRQQNQNILSRFMQLDSLPDLYQPPSHDARETNRGNLSKGISINIKGTGSS